MKNTTLTPNLTKKCCDKLLRIAQMFVSTTILRPMALHILPIQWRMLTKIMCSVQKNSVWSCLMFLRILQPNFFLKSHFEIAFPDATYVKTCMSVGVQKLVSILENIGFIILLLCLFFRKNTTETLQIHITLLKFCNVCKKNYSKAPKKSK